MCIRDRVGHGAAEPALGDVIGVAAAGQFLDCFLGLLFAADKKHLFAAGGDTEEEVLRGFELLDGVFEVCLLYTSRCV